MRTQWNQWRTGRNSRNLAILGILCVSLILRADDGCFTADRDVSTTTVLRLRAEWNTQGFTENTSRDSGNLASFADDIFDALDDVDDLESIDASAITVAGGAAGVILNRGHDSARTAEVTIDVGGSKVPVTLIELAVDGNSTGTTVNATASAATSPYLVLNGAALNALRDEFRLFIEQVQSGNEVAARATLDGISWEANWSSITDPPTQGDPDDFDWYTEIILHIPASIEVTVPNI